MVALLSLSLIRSHDSCSNSSTGNPLPIANRQPEPASRPERFSVPSSKASDVAENPYFRRDTRRNYPKTEVVTQPELAKLLIAQGGFESSVGRAARGPLGPRSRGTCSRDHFPKLTLYHPTPPGSRPSRLPRVPSRPPSRPTRPRRRSPRSTRPTPRSRPLRSARPSLLASSSRRSRPFLRGGCHHCPAVSNWALVDDLQMEALG